ncbi:MAG: histidine kinase dimerization/phospho-acceptor domain-containing protein [Saprospiraceae bacterium]
MKRNDSVRRPTVPALDDVHHTNAELPISNHHGLCYIIDPTGMIKSIDNVYKQTRINFSSNKSFFSYLDEESQTAAKKVIDLVFAGMPTNSFSAHARKGDGSSQYLSIIVSPLIYNDDIKMVSLICHEIEFPKNLSVDNLIASEEAANERELSSLDLKRENEELKRVNQFLDNFVTGAAHDLRSPLVVLKTFPDLIRRFTDVKRRHKALDTMKEATIKMEHILDCMMQFVEAQKNEAQQREELYFSEMFDTAFGRLCFELEGINPIFFFFF